MESLYQQVIEFVICSGKRLRERAGKIKDIGITKSDLTEEDIRIERELEALVKKNAPNSAFYAEEEHHSSSAFTEGDTWVADPISGTRTFIRGLPNYAIVASHLKGGKVQFAVVYDPSVDELYTAYRGKGSFLNGKRIFVSNHTNNLKVVFNLSQAWKDECSSTQMKAQLERFHYIANPNSHAVNLSHVTCGRYDGAVSFCKDSFPYFAASLLVQEAGGVFTNAKGEEDIHPEDRVFICGNAVTYAALKECLQRVELPRNI